MVLNALILCPWATETAMERISGKHCTHTHPKSCYLIGCWSGCAPLRISGEGSVWIRRGQGQGTIAKSSANKCGRSVLGCIDWRV